MRTGPLPTPSGRGKARRKRAEVWGTEGPSRATEGDAGAKTVAGRWQTRGIGGDHGRAGASGKHRTQKRARGHSRHRVRRISIPPARSGTAVAREGKRRRKEMTRKILQPSAPSPFA